jgi:type II secretory ATPase GspE/PulE/Tfp pilus assembly ATPase PilB-like protein
MHMAFEPLAALIATLEVGPYINVVKIVPPLLLLLIWGRLLTWVDKDTDRAHLSREGTNLALLGGMTLAYAMFFFMPSFLIGFLVLIFVWLAEIGAYLGIRNSKIGLKDLKKEFGEWVSSLRGKKSVKVVAGAVTFFDKKGGPVPVPDSESPDLPAYEALQTLFTDPLRKNADRIDVTPSEGASQVKFSVDGFPYSGQSLDRAAATAAIAYLKPLAGLNLEEKRKPQTGTMKVQLDGKKKELDVNMAGSSAGEFIKVQVDTKKRHGLKIEQMGFSPEQLAAVKDSILNQKGVVLIASPRGQGLTTMLYSMLRAHDAFVQHIQTIERTADQDLEGVTQNKLAANAPAAEEAKLVGWVASQEPDVMLINQMEDPGTPQALIAYTGEGEGRRAYIGMRAGSTFDALAIWRKLVGDDKLAMERLNMVISGRIMRKLCMACKVAYAPEPEQLKKLNLNPAKAAQLFQARREPMRDPKGNPIPCDFCHELRYMGRFGVYEVLLIDEDIKNVVAAGGSVNQLKAAFRKQKGKLLQEMALSRVEAGDTSLAEVKRVMEAGAAPAGSAGAAPARSAPRTAARPASE